MRRPTLETIPSRHFWGEGYPGRGNASARYREEGGVEYGTNKSSRRTRVILDIERYERLAGAAEDADNAREPARVMAPSGAARESAIPSGEGPTAAEYTMFMTRSADGAPVTSNIFI